DEGESCAHLPIDDVVLGSARSVGSLAGEDPEHIPIERDMLANLVRWKILARVGDERIDGAIELISSTVPVETIVLAFIADQFLRELLGEIRRRTRRIFLLGVDQLTACIYGGQFIFADAS